jgi:hypothetical protein
MRAKSRTSAGQLRVHARRRRRRPLPAAREAERVVPPLCLPHARRTGAAARRVRT